MVATIKDYVEELWWLFILQGIATIAFGLVALFMPGLTLVALLVTLAVYAIIIGIIDMVHGFSAIGKSATSWFSIILGVVLVGIGIYLVRNPSVSMSALILTAGTILLVRGVFDVIAAIFFGTKDDHRWLMAISGVLGVVAGIYVWSNPAAGGLAFVWAIGLYALITGSITIAYAMHMKGAFDEIKRTIEQGGGKGGRIAHGHR